MQNSPSKFVSFLVRRNASLRALALTALTGWLVLYGNDLVLRNAMRRNTSSRVNWLFNAAGGEYEIAILGSSMAKEGVDPNLLTRAPDEGKSSERDLAKDVIQLAWGGRGVSEQALYFELFLQRNQCNTLLLELHPRGLEKNVLQHPLDEYRYLAWLDDPIVFRHVARHCGWLQTKLWQMVPMLGFAQFSTQVGWHDLLAARKAQFFDPNLPVSPASPPDHVGLASDLVERLETQASDPERRPGFSPLDPRSIIQLEEIIDLCQQNGIRIIAFIPPLFQISTTEKKQARVEAELQSWLTTYRSLLGSEIAIFIPTGNYLRSASHFVDSLHVNEAGRVEFTRELGNFLQLQ